MADWRGEGLSVGALYLAMAERELRGVSSSYERLCRGVATDADIAAWLATLPPPKRQPNLLLGAVRFLDGSVEDFPAFRDWLLDHRDPVAQVMLTRRTQTNELRRTATLLPALTALRQPLALLEVGASAGLCLYPDRQRYRYDTADGVRYVGAGPVELRCAVTGPAPLPARPPVVGWRAGLDLNPLDVRDPQDTRWLRSLIWPEQRERFAILDAAIALTAADPPRLVAGDLVRDVADLVAEIPAGLTAVVFHSAVLAYVDAAGRAEFTATMGRLAAERGVVWLSNEAPGVIAGTACDTGGVSRFVLARDARPLALTGPHGDSLNWLDQLDEAAG